MLPDEHCKAAYDNPCVGPLQGHALPIQGEKYSGAEAGAKAGPGVGNDGENVAVGIRAQIYGNGGNQKEQHASF